MRRFAFAGIIVFATTVIFAAPQLPESDGDESFDVEPPILIPNQDREKARGKESGGVPSPIVDLERLEKEVDRSVRSARNAEQLFKMGALAKAEVEQRALRIVRLQSDLENARLQRAKEELESQRARAASGKIPQAALDEAQAVVVLATEAAQAAAAKRDKAEIEAAETNLRRQQKLFALGTAGKSEVARAERKLAELKASKQ